LKPVPIIPSRLSSQVECFELLEALLKKNLLTFLNFTAYRFGCAQNVDPNGSAQRDCKSPNAPKSTKTLQENYRRPEIVIKDFK